MPGPAHRHKRGQAVVLVAIAALLLTAVLMLALDGGGIYLDRRQLQNAADAASLAGVEGFSPGALNYSAINTNAVNLLTTNLPGSSLPGGVNLSLPRVPPAGLLDIGAGYQVSLEVTNPYSYRVTVKHTHSVAVAPVHGFASTIDLQVQATAQNVNLPYALILLQDQQANYHNLFLNGSPGVGLTLKGGGGAGDKGGAFSNASMDLGAQGTVTFNPCGNAGDLWAVSEDPSQATTMPRVSGGQATGNTVSCVPPTGIYPMVAGQALTDPGYPEPVPPSATYNSPINVSHDAMYLCPGTYNSSISVSGGTVILMPGVYRVTGSISISGFSTSFRTATAADFPPSDEYSTNCGATPTAPVDGDYGVILEIATSSCAANQLSETGQGTMNLATSPKYNKISLYVEPMANWRLACTGGVSGTTVVNIAGQGKYTIKGLLYAPADNLRLCGNASGSGVGQVIGWTLQICGNGNLDETYDPASLPYIKGLVQ